MLTNTDVLLYLYRIKNNQATKDATMSAQQISMFDTPAVIKNQAIERVYITRGKNTFNQAGQVCDRMSAVQIGGKLHWIDKTLATFDDLDSLLNPLGVIVNFAGEYGIVDKAVSVLTSYDHKVTKLKGSESEIFGSDSSYMDRSERCNGDSIWWTVDKIKNKYFSDIK